MKNFTIINLLEKFKFFLLFFCFLTSAQITLVKDIRPGTGGGLVNNPETLVFNNHLYFFADDGIHGKELWKSDGTEAGTVLVKDIVVGSGSSAPTNLTKAGNVLYFTANDGVYGRELWKTDGTEQGTVMVKNIDPNTTTPNHPNSLFEYNNMLFFAATNGTQGVELWKSDGTFNGTIMVRDINDGFGSSHPRNFGIHNNYLYFTAAGFNEDNTLFVGDELYRTAGDGLSTELVMDIFPGGVLPNVNSSNPGPVISFGNNPVFTATVPENGSQASFRRLASISGNSFLNTLSNYNPENPVKSGNLVFYVTAANNSVGKELYATNGIQGGGPGLIKDIRVGSASSNPTGLIDLNGTLLFSADDGVNGIELWKSNGTASGTVLVKDIRPGQVGSAPGAFGKVIQNKLFFSANDGVHGRELWVSDGTEDGTFMVMDLNPGSGFSEPSSFVEFNNSVYFTANVSGIGYELFRLDLSSLSSVRPLSTKELSYYFDNQTKKLHFNELDGHSNVKLYNIMGMQIKDAQSAEKELIMDLSTLSSGVYIFNINSENMCISKKIRIN